MIKYLTSYCTEELWPMCSVPEQLLVSMELSQKTKKVVGQHVVVLKSCGQTCSCPEELWVNMELSWRVVGQHV